MPIAMPLAALLLLATPAPAPAPPPAADAPAPAPRGDEALIVSMKEAHLGLTGARSRARYVLGELNGARYDEKLAKLSSAPGEAGVRASTLRLRLVAAWQALYQAVSGRQPIDAHAGCRRQEQIMREALSGPPGSVAAARLPVARADALACQRQLSAMLELARARLAAAEAAMGEAKAHLAAPAAPPAVP